MSLTIAVDHHSLLEICAFVTRAAQPISQLATPAGTSALATAAAQAPFSPTDDIRTAVRDLLRQGGFKPAGRSKPASEYLVAAFAEDRFPRINALVDTCNVVSLHTGLPISLVDLDKLEGALAVRVAPPGTSYVFNPAGQVIDVSGLLCLYDERGPSGSPVKDAQRTKTDDGTRHTLSIIWGTRALPERAARAAQWYRELVAAVEGASVEDVVLA
ncbi:MAG TPA: phenylalanine--tRNA ligase beta subunit-related protein [Kofleriaceae bacterium]|nr:phenylalanine--tRNA ligase beta subunit-related protein [Kofleriaceae bacterium]